jgi:hypothetical protein
MIVPRLMNRMVPRDCAIKTAEPKQGTGWVLGVLRLRQACHTA